MCLDKWSAAPWSDENGGLATFPKDKKRERRNDRGARVKHPFISVYFSRI